MGLVVEKRGFLGRTSGMMDANVYAPGMGKGAVNIMHLSVRLLPLLSARKASKFYFYESMHMQSFNYAISQTIHPHFHPKKSFSIQSPSSLAQQLNSHLYLYPYHNFSPPFSSLNLACPSPSPNTLPPPLPPSLRGTSSTGSAGASGGVG